MSLTRPAEKRKATITAQLEAHIATGALSGHMLAVSRKVVANPRAFSPDDAAKLRNAAQVASASADLIDRGLK